MHRGGDLSRKSLTVERSTWIDARVHRDGWDSSTPTQPNYPGSELRWSFELNLGDESVWVNGNATKHMVEYPSFLADGGGVEIRNRYGHTGTAE